MARKIMMLPVIATAALVALGVVASQGGTRQAWAREDGRTSESRDAYRSSDGNLLTNPGFELTDGVGPRGWTAVELPGGTGHVSFQWSRRAASGDRAAGATSTGSRRGLWQQVVAVDGGHVYSLSGRVAFEGLDPPATCRLEALFRDGEGGLIQPVLLPGHDGTRGYEVDYPYPLMFRAPEGAEVAEINGYVGGPGSAWFDDLYFGEAPVGDISGTVTVAGYPVAGARVWVLGDPWDAVTEAYTDDAGRYVIEDVPAALPRYIVLASKAGFKTRPAGNVDVAAGGAVTVELELEPGHDPLDDLEVGYGCLEMVAPSQPREIPEDAEIPTNPDDYPASVSPYLRSDEWITADDPTVVALAEELLQGVPAEDRGRTREVAWAVYEWVARNVTHDAVFGSGVEPYRDVTSGIWQTIQPGGWCWGRSFYDWAYRPAELLEARTGICVEHSWLSCALLRALGIPARARIGSAQFWVQRPGEEGFWVGISTNGGSNDYREHGILGTGFGGHSDWAFVPVTSRPFLHEDWDMERPGMWHERHPWGVRFPATVDGLAEANADMDRFADTGVSGDGEPVAPGEPRYEIHYSFVTLNLYNIGDQQAVDVRFPMVTESDTHQDMGRRVYWTNHSECVLGTWIEEVPHESSEQVQRWFHVELDVSSLLGVPRPRASTGRR